MFRHNPVSNQQTGVALPVALIMTLLVALLGMNMLRGGIVNELVTSNQQQKFLTDEAAQSGVEAVWDYSYLKDEISESMENSFNNPEPTVQPISVTGISMENDANGQYDLSASKGSVDINGEVTIQFCGESEAIGGSLDASESSTSLVAALVDVTSNTTIANTNARSLVVQRAAITSVRSGRVGNCVIH